MCFKVGGGGLVVGTFGKVGMVGKLPLHSFLKVQSFNFYKGLYYDFKIGSN